MAREAEDTARELVETVLGVRFEGRRVLSGWGRTDGCTSLGDGRWALLEVETTQKHPCTNVLKVWPYLEERPEESVVLIHVFTVGAKNESSSRGNLGTWIAAKMAEALGQRFKYFRLLISADGQLLGDLDGAMIELAAARQAR